jgi:hypothetical protein
MNQSIEVIDDFLDKKDHELILNTMNSNNFPWYCTQYVANEFASSDLSKEENFYFSHLFYDKYEFTTGESQLIVPIMKLINPTAIVRIRANLTYPQKQKSAGFHIDESFNGKTAVYYVNTNNGKTIFEDGKEVDSVANRILIFDSNIYHSPVFSDDKRRIVINLNWVPRNV